MGINGNGFVIASADTGVQYDHPAIVQMYRGRNSDGSFSHDYNWYDSIHNANPLNPCGSNSPAPCDDNGHGTHTVGTSLGDDFAGNRIGVAWGAKWIGCRNMDQNDGTPARYIECLQFFMAPTNRNGEAPQPSLRPHVIINSYGCPISEGCTDLNVLRQTIENVVAAGIFMSVSAGNSGRKGCSTIQDPPAVTKASFAVGASAVQSNNIASFSSRGPVRLPNELPRISPEVIAPGSGVYSSYITNDYRSLS
jgi:serine protease AprX